MDVGHMIVGVLITAAASWLVWAEIHSRRNQARQRAICGRGSRYSELK